MRSIGQSRQPSIDPRRRRRRRRRRRFREVFAQLFHQTCPKKILEMIVFIAAIDSIKFSSKSELSSRFFGRLKFSKVFRIFHFLQFSLDFGGAGRFWMSKSTSLSNFASGGPIHRSVQPLEQSISALMARYWRVNGA